MKKILVVDDDASNRNFLSEILPKYGFIVDSAEDGEEALERLKQFSPDLILLDNVMPKMSGLELVKILKADDNYKNIFVIIFTALDSAENKNKCLEAGVGDYIAKPINFKQLLERINAAIEGADK